MTNDLTEKIPIHDWPECDRKALNTALQPSSILDDHGSLSHLCVEAVENLMRYYGRWLRYLCSQNLFDPTRSGVEFLSPDLLRGYIAMLRSNLASATVANYVAELGRLALLFRSETDWGFVQTTARQLRRNAQPVRDSRTRCRPSKELYELGLKLMKTAEAQSDPIGRAREFRNGLIISLLAARPLRIRNLAMIAMHRHLQLRGERYWVHFEPVETKNRRPLDFYWPESLHNALIQYLEIHRPILAGSYFKNCNLGDRLWVIRDRGHFHYIITTKTAEHFGKPVYPHLFRHAAATSTAIEDPKHVGIIMTILGHASFRTAEKYYNKATSIDAARRYQNYIGELRSNAPRR